jgi:indole-3-glycerol phosphate synthase
VADILSEIIDKKKARTAASQLEVPLDRLRTRVADSGGNRERHAFSAALSNSNELNIIAEFKRRSPSKGIIQRDADPVKTATAYTVGGARAISVLTEEDFFDGSLADLRAVRAATSLPILRKDFIFSEYQLWESAAAAADAVLLIVSALTDHELQSLRQIAEDKLGMDALVEVHSETEMERAIDAGAKLIGANNRNLRDFNVSLDVSERLARKAPSGTVLISESGLRTRADLLRLRAIGFSGFLIGEMLMKSADPKAALRSFLSES